MPPAPPKAPIPPKASAPVAAPAPTALLKSIVKGAKLKKTKTNDRSAPIIEAPKSAIVPNLKSTSKPTISAPTKKSNDSITTLTDRKMTIAENPLKPVLKSTGTVKQALIAPVNATAKPPLPAQTKAAPPPPPAKKMPPPVPLKT